MRPFTNPKADDRPRRGSWAPGGYVKACSKCAVVFCGDKRAGMCADCAYAEPAREMLTADDVRRMIRESAEMIGQKQLAADIGVSAQYVCDVLQGRREPGQSICDGFGIERIVLYRRVKLEK